MNTNADLMVALSIITNFADVMPVSKECVPRTPEDVRAFVVGRRPFPYDLFLSSKGGGEFWIMRGAVAIYNGPGSFFRLQDPREIPKFVGNAKLGTNDVLRLASTAVHQLLVCSNALANITPVVRTPRPYKGRQIPFFDVTWPRPENPGVISIARVEVDASRGVVVSSCLTDLAFDNPGNVQQISNAVHQVQGLASTNLATRAEPPRPRQGEPERARPGPTGPP